MNNKKLNPKVTQRFLEDLATYISFRSISTDPKYLGEVEKTVRWLKNYMEAAGGRAEVFQKNQTNPVVLGYFEVGVNVPTILVYGHYDVQPAEAADGWTTSDPFILEQKILSEKKKKVERLVARGVVDNKGQNFIHLFTISELFKQRRLKYNVKIMLEGNEESGNPDLPNILKENKDKFKCDYVLVSDGEIVGDSPVCEVSLRGGGNMRVVFTTGKNNLHSGIYGGAVPNAANELVKTLSTLKDKKNKVLVKDFYKNVAMPTKAVLENNKILGSEKEVIKLAGVKQLLTLSNFDFFTQTGCLPTLEISGIKTGYIGEGFANIVPATAEARINIRAASNQKTKKVIQLIKTHILQNTPKYVDVDIQSKSYGDPIKLNNDCREAEEIKVLLQKIYGSQVVNKYVGGLIPILGDLQKILKTKVISVSLGNDDCNMHGADENFRVDLVQKGLQFAEAFWGN